MSRKDEMGNECEDKNDVYLNFSEPPSSTAYSDRRCGIFTCSSSRSNSRMPSVRALVRVCVSVRMCVCVCACVCVCMCMFVCRRIGYYMLEHNVT